MHQKQICLNMFLSESNTTAMRQWVQEMKDQWFFAEHNTINGLVSYKILIRYGATRSRAGIDNNKHKLHALT